MAATNNLTVERLKELLRYDEATGVFTWLARPSKCVRIGSEAGHIHANGYRRICIDRVLHSGQRLAWLYVHGEWPAAVIDHINRDRSDNRLCNLREASWSQNQQNRVRNKNNSTGYTGVGWDKKNQCWKPHIMVSSKTLHLGRYKDLTTAINARRLAEQKYFTHATMNGVPI